MILFLIDEVFRITKEGQQEVEHIRWQWYSISLQCNTYDLDENSHRFPCVGWLCKYFSISPVSMKQNNNHKQRWYSGESRTLVMYQELRAWILIASKRCSCNTVFFLVFPFLLSKKKKKINKMLLSVVEPAFC